MAWLGSRSHISATAGGAPARALRLAIDIGWGLLLVLACLGTGCERGPTPPKLLIVGIDGAEWRMVQPLMAAGELPHLQRVIESGVSGPLWSLKPILSPVVWTTIATGKGPDQHGVLDFTVPDPNTGRMIVVTSQIRRSKAFWNILSERGLSVCVVGWWATWPAEPVAGVIVSDRLSYHAFIESPEATEGLVSPPEKLPEILALRHDPAEVPYEEAQRFIDVTPQEYAAAPSLDFYDPISHFRHIYATMNSYADIARHLLETEEPDVMAVYFEGVDTAGHMYVRYAPPPYPGTTDAERRKFGETVEAFYRHQDRLLGELLALTDEQTTVMIVSDHGFLLGRERPIEEGDRFDYATAAGWHRLEGLFAMRGPQIKSAATPPGRRSPFQRVSVFDITPTALTLLGLPIANDMEGRLLSELLVEGQSAPPRIASYEDQAWRESRARAQSSVAAVDDEMKQRLRSLGYIGAQDTEAEMSLWGQWSLAEYYLFRNQPEKAEAELLALRERAPDWPDTYFLLGSVYAQRGELERARAMYEKVLELDPSETEAKMNLAYVHRQMGQLPQAIALMRESAEAHPRRADLRINLGILYREAGRLERAREVFDALLRRDPRSHPAHAQRALVAEARGNRQTAIEHWEAAVRLNPRDRTARRRLEALRSP
ncbi:MAG: tetratricopeptide repeat protein [Candidatus Eisenbacteria bacterium]|nr:tetratricopeptide repeat protein [Candidatus Eisenbacteria bacterium]